MQIMLYDNEAQSNITLDADIVFLYKLRHGLELSSHASQCEKLCGMPQPIIDRAAYISQLSLKHNLKALEVGIRSDLCQGRSSGQDHDQSGAQAMRRAEAVARAFASWDIEADKQCAAEMGETAWLDPMAKLSRILNTTAGDATVSSKDAKQSLNLFQDEEDLN